ncbi:uncharacterized protein LOC144119451 [Amblyomma americanum]
MNGFRAGLSTQDIMGQIQHDILGRGPIRATRTILGLGTIRVLGMLVQNNTQNSEAIQRLRTTAHQMNGLIRRIATRRRGMRETDLCRLTQALLLSRIVYSFPYYHLRRKDEEVVNSVIRSAYKAAMGLPQFASTQRLLQLGQKLELFFTATPTTPPRSEAAKTAILLSAAGEEALDVYNNFSFEAVPVTHYRRLKNTASLQKSTAVLKAYNGSAIKHVGVDREILVLNGVAHVVTFFVVKKGRQAILGLQTCQQFGLVPKAVDSVEWNETAPEKAFPDLFQGTGCVGRQYRMVLRADAVPVVHPARRVPLALRDPLRQELERMEKAAIIKKVDEPTEWFVPGKDLLLADMLSRAPVPTQASSASSEADCDIHAVQVVSSIVSTPMKERLEKEIRDDPYLSEKMAALRANCCKADASALPCLNTTRILVSQCESIANLRGERYCHLSKRAVQFVCTATTGHAQQQ